jgi:hypothetical protein
MEVAVREHDMSELEAQAEPPVGFEEEGPSPAASLPEPPMYVEETSGGIFRGIRHRVVYPTADRSGDQGLTPSPHGGLPQHDVDGTPPVRPRRNYERLPIVGSIYETMSREGQSEVGVTASVRSLDGPTLEDTLEASSIAGSAARELAEMARFEEGPDMVPEEADMLPEARRLHSGETEAVLDEVGELAEALEEVIPEEPPEPPKAKRPKGRRAVKPRVKSTARKVKHPTGSLKSRGKKGRAETVYEEEEALVGVVEWDGHDEDQIEEEDLFNPRRLADEEDGDDRDEGPEEGSDEWAEEERIAALVREREDWDRL